jgi:hypothetical protein
MLIQKYPTALLIPLLLLWVVASCNSDHYNSDHYRYRAEITVDGVVVADTITRGDSALFIYTMPAGCNHSPRLETRVSHDSILCLLTLEFYYAGLPCAHGPVVDSLYVGIDPGKPDDYLLVYRDTDSSRVAVPLTVLYPD